MRCENCIAWNLPLVLPARLTQYGVALSYEQWIIYRLHVEMHQHGNWAGEIESIAPMLAINLDMTLMDPVQLVA